MTPRLLKLVTQSMYSKLVRNMEHCTQTRVYTHAWVFAGWGAQIEEMANVTRVGCIVLHLADICVSKDAPG